MESKNVMDIRAELRKPFPPEAITPHPTKTFLSTIKAIYVTERLNDLFGIGGWTLEHEIISDEPDYVAVRGQIVIGEPYNIKTPMQYGGHNKTGKNTEPADGYKSAMTDCQSKCASYLEIGIDVFKGTKVSTGQPRKAPVKATPAPQAPVEDIQDFISPEQLKAVDDLLNKLSLNRENLGTWLKETGRMGVDDVTKMDKAKATRMIEQWDTFSADVVMNSMNQKPGAE